jgi:mono/diheme cytochrome c family protein
MPSASSSASAKRQRPGTSRSSWAWLGAAALLVSCFAEPTLVDEPLPTGSGGTGTTSGGRASGATGQDGGEAGDGGNPSGVGGSSGGTAAVGGTENGNAGEAPDIGFACPDPLAEPLPARQAVTSGEIAPRPEDSGFITITKAGLFAEFNRLGCGDLSGCHGGADQPNNQSPQEFKVTIDSFDDRKTLGTEALGRILSDDPDEWMPPDGGDGSKRGPNDPFRKFGERLLRWQEAGFPEQFEITASGEAVDHELSDDPYLLSKDLGAKLSNLGSCIPQKPAALVRAVDEMREKDALFTALETSDDLPDTIFETDLVSLDSSDLARRNVYSYAPTYTLYSDHAGKMRHLRVPVGETIRYNPETRDFDIPENTRFYKTFLKEVRDKDDSVGYRKMETRLIVSRPDERLADGSFRPRALRAAYAWDKDERMARRVKDPFRDGSAAADRLCPYVVDESVERDPQKNPIQQPVNENCTYMTSEELENPSSGKIRHYAIPSTQRCDQCHMGSHSRSYILGFDPFQVDRRAPGEGGVYEDAKADELTQLARLIEYGVITGIEPGQAKLEESQGARKPRNDYELKAQAYMIGNCAFCHNPNGFPVVQNPLLRGFELYPNAENGGIFEFSLERYSPRAKGGLGQDIRIPYITSTFGDLNFTTSSSTNAKPKSGLALNRGDETPVIDPEDSAVDYDPSEALFTFLGPWRSLIWRNVYTPFTYAEDGTIFIHMPRNAAGHDCRAQKIMAEWMLSIPSVPKAGSVNRDQPDREVGPRSGSRRQYEAALAEAAARIDIYSRSVTGMWCPEDDDLVDPKVLLSPVDPATGAPRVLSPPDLGITGPRVNPNHPEPTALTDAVPDHAHWVVVDTTDPSDRWSPRRGNWKELIATRELTVPEDLVPVVDHLQDIRVTPELTPFALDPLPMGLWHSACNNRPELASEPLVSELVAEGDGDLRRWLSAKVFMIDSVGTGRVHRQSRGEAVFRAICQNCHGKYADSQSPLGATILELSGGRTRVANFVDGLLGPRTAPGAFSRGEFLLDFGGTPDDWQARYMLFMGLGGTSAVIPKVVLDLVGTSPFYGQTVRDVTVDDPNMLASAQTLCGKILRSGRILKRESAAAPRISSGEFVRTTAHYELWESICARDNQPVVHVFAGSEDEFGSGTSDLYRAQDETGAWLYPPDAWVGDEKGRITRGIAPENRLPWCLKPRNAGELEAIRAWAVASGVPETNIPLCPEPLFAQVVGKEIYRLDDTDPVFGNQDFTRRWVRQGAMNAGLVALQYLRALTSGAIEPARSYDFCLE